VNSIGTLIPDWRRGKGKDVAGNRSSPINRFRVLERANPLSPSGTPPSPVLWVCNTASATLRLHRNAARKFTVIYRQQLGRKLHVNKISFTRFTNSVIFPDFYRDIHIPLGRFGGLEKVFWVEREEILRFWGGISLLD
jgi:hypothetical protein